jgi:hypothetical protein
MLTGKIRMARNKYNLRNRWAIFHFAATFILLAASCANAEPLRIAYTSIAVVYGPLWLTKDAGLFKKYNIEPEFIYIAGGPPSLQALIAGDVAISFTAGGATVAANLQGADVVLLGATIDSLPFEMWSIPSIKSPEQLKGTRLGVSRIGATTDFVARYLLKKWNLQPDKDVAIFQTGSGPQIFAAMKGGSVQSGVLSTGAETLSAESSGYVRLADVSTSGLVYPFGPFAARAWGLDGLNQRNAADQQRAEHARKLRNLIFEPDFAQYRHFEQSAIEGFLAGILRGIQQQTRAPSIASSSSASPPTASASRRRASSKPPRSKWTIPNA